MEEEADVSSDAPVRPDEAAAAVVLERGPGVHVVADAQPARAGRALAAALDADLADTPVTARLAIQARLARSQRSPVAVGEIDLRDGAREPVATPANAVVEQRVSERLASYDAAAEIRTLASAHVARLRQLAGRVERAERVLARTERAVGEQLGAPVRAPATVDPEELRDASADLLEARLAMAALEASDEPATEPGAYLEPIERDQSGGPPLKPRNRPPDSTLIAGGVLLLGVALAGAILLTSVPPVLSIAPILLGLFLAGLIRRSPRTTGWANTSRGLDSMSLPARVPVSINAPTAGGAVPPTAPPEREPMVDKVAELAAARGRLDEARRRWAALAGATADPGAVEGLATPHPGRGSEPNLVSESAAVRAASHVVSRAREAWVAAWADLGEVAPADVTPRQPLDAALKSVQQRIDDHAEIAAATETGDDPAPESAEPGGRRGLTRRRLNELLATRTLEFAIASEPGPSVPSMAPLVLVEPFAGLNSERRAEMQSRLEALAERHEVIVIVRDSTAGPRTENP